MLDKLLEPVQRGLMWFSSKPNRLRVRGARIEVMAFLVTRKPAAILLGQSPYHEMWMPPQEGVRLEESFADALRRCLEVECGLDLPSDTKSLDRLFYARSFRFMGLVALPPERQGERPVADDAVGTALEAVTLKRKAYWMATVVLRDRDDIKPIPDGNELVDLRWFSFQEASHLFRTTNHPEKAELLLKSIDACRRDLLGGASPNDRVTSVPRGRDLRSGWLRRCSRFGDRPSRFLDFGAIARSPRPTIHSKTQGVSDVRSDEKM